MINTNIYVKELKRYRNSFFGWSVAIIIFNFMGMAFYPLLMQEDMLKQITAFLENPFMKNMMTAFGASIDIWTNVLGFYSTRNALFIMLIGSFYSILLAGKILAREEQEKTAEFLLAKPVTRLEIVWSKLAVHLTYLILLNIVILIIGFFLYPSISIIKTSFYQTRYGINFNFAGLKNYLLIFGDEVFHASLVNSLIWTVTGLILQLTIPLGTALLLNQRFGGNTLARATMLVPWITPSVIIAIMARWILEPELGMLNSILLR